MAKVSFSDIFSGEYLQVINKYCERIQSILANYDIVIFMARKAICFYEAMVSNGEILPSDSIIVSSRVLDYNFIKDFEKKKIAIVDDVVVKGDSLRKVASILCEFGIKADAYVVACEQNFNDEFISKFSDCRLQKTYSCLTTKAIYSFSAMITEYIEASMCPFNIDQPIFSGIDEDGNFNSFLNVSNALNLSSGLQDKFKIQNKVLYFTVNVNLSNKLIEELLNKSILKIRFLLCEEKIKAIPFVLFPEMGTNELNQIFSCLETPEILNFISKENINLTLENKLKIINYFYSEILLIIFIRKYNLKFQKNDVNDVIQFAKSTDTLYGSILKQVFNKYFENFELLNIVDLDFSKFAFSEAVATVYRAIGNIDVATQQYTNADGTKLSSRQEPIITTKYLESFININSCNKKYIVSSVIDVLIDKGMIVPAIVHCPNDGIIRAYKLGEYSKLSREQVREFAHMLKIYQDSVNDDLDRTEFEKLCVIYFATAIHRNHFKQQTNYEDDCYGISYSLYGPRISTGKVSYKVNPKSALANKFLDLDERIMRENSKKKYIISSNYGGTNDVYQTMFALKYSELRKLFSASSGWNKYSYTYIQYLTLRAIGDSNKSKFLSLCAELYQLVQLNDDIFNVDKLDITRHGLILSGINSGLWKYQCFKNNVLDDTFKILMKKDIKLAMAFGDDFGEENDKNKIWDTIIQLCAESLYSIAYLLNEVIIKYSLGANFDLKNILKKELEQSEGRKLVFTARNYYCKEFDSIRLDYEKLVSETDPRDIQKCVKNEIIKLKRKAQFILDFADLYLESNNANYTHVSKMLVVYSAKSMLPKNLCEDLQCLEIKGIDKEFGKKCRCYKLDWNLSGIPVLVDILNKYNTKKKLHFIVMNMLEWYEGFVQIDNKVSGRFAVNLLNEIIKHINCLPISTSSNSLTVVGKKFDKTFEKDGYKFMRKEDDVLQFGSRYVAEGYNIFKSSSQLNNSSTISIGVICALDKELNAVLTNIERTFNVKRNLKIDKECNNRDYYYFNFNYNKKNISVYVVEQRRQGNTSSCAAYCFLTKYSLDFIVFCGIAGSLKKDIKIGDVLLPNEIFDTTLKKEIGDTYLLRGKVHNVSPKLIGYIKLLVQNTQLDSFGLSCEPIASDNTVIACEDSEIIKKVLMYNDKVAGVEMESAGLYEADYEFGQTKNGAMTIRGISDNADHIKNDNFHKLASENAAKVLCEFIKLYINLS